MNQIHPTAVVCPSVELVDVSVGAYSIIEKGAIVGKGTRIGAYCYIRSCVSLGENNELSNHISLGNSGYIRGFDKSIKSYLKIGNANVFKNNVVINRSMKEGEATVIGDHNYFGELIYFSHDCIIGDYNFIKHRSGAAGHVTIGNHSYFDAFVFVHQFCSVGDYTILDYASKCDQNMIPMTKIKDGKIMELLTPEELKNFKLTPQEIDDVLDAYKKIFQKGKTIRECIAELTPEDFKSKGLLIYNFCRQHVDSNRGFAI